MSPFISHMDAALDEARAAAARGEVPVGAILSALDGTVLATAGNRVLEQRDPTAHAEMLVIRDACASLGSERLPGCVLTVTLEPCAMCAAAIAGARIARVVFGAEDPKSGGVLHGARVFSHPQAHHRPEIVDGVRAQEASELLRAFFADRRAGEDQACWLKGLGFDDHAVLHFCVQGFSGLFEDQKSSGVAGNDRRKHQEWI